MQPLFKFKFYLFRGILSYFELFGRDFQKKSLDQLYIKIKFFIKFLIQFQIIQ